jgi:anti-sigma B factor antagonist
MTLKVKMMEKSPGVFHLAPVGSIDTASAPILEGEVNRALAASPRVVIFEMGGVDYISSMGVRVVIKTKKELARRGARFAMVEVPPPVKRVFEIINALPREEIFRSVEELDEYLSAMQKKVREGEE